MCAFIRECCCPHLRYLNKAVSLQIYKKYNWQCASAMLATCTARIKGWWVGPRALLHCVFQAKIILADFNLAALTPTAKLPNLILCHIFRLYSNSRTFLFPPLIIGHITVHCCTVETYVLCLNHSAIGCAECFKPNTFRVGII